MIYNQWLDWPVSAYRPGYKGLCSPYPVSSCPLFSILYRLILPCPGFIHWVDTCSKTEGAHKLQKVRLLFTFTFAWVNVTTLRVTKRATSVAFCSQSELNDLTVTDCYLTFIVQLIWYQTIHLIIVLLPLLTIFCMMFFFKIMLGTLKLVMSFLSLILYSYWTVYATEFPRLRVKTWCSVVSSRVPDKLPVYSVSYHPRKVVSYFLAIQGSCTRIFLPCKFTVTWNLSYNNVSFSCIAVALILTTVDQLSGQLNTERTLLDWTNTAMACSNLSWGSEVFCGCCVFSKGGALV